MSRVLIAGAVASSAYLSFQIYSHFTAISSSKPEIDIKILTESSSALTTPFPAHSELLRARPRLDNASSSSLCESLRRQFEYDWNRFLHFVSERL